MAGDPERLPYRGAPTDPDVPNSGTRLLELPSTKTPMKRFRHPEIRTIGRFTSASGPFRPGSPILGARVRSGHQLPHSAAGSKGCVPMTIVIPCRQICMASLTPPSGRFLTCCQIRVVRIDSVFFKIVQLILYRVNYSSDKIDTLKLVSTI